MNKTSKVILNRNCTWPQLFNIFLLLFSHLGVNTAAQANTYIVLNPISFQRASGAPVTETINFSIANPGSGYTLNLYNGGIEDDDVTGELVSSGKVWLNGAQIVGSNNFNQQTSLIAENIALQSYNDLSVQLKGKPGGVITIEITSTDNEPPTIDATVSPQADSNGWNTTPVVVSQLCRRTKWDLILHR